MLQLASPLVASFGRPVLAKAHQLDPSTSSHCCLARDPAGGGAVVHKRGGRGGIGLRRTRGYQGRRLRLRPDNRPAVMCRLVVPRSHCRPGPWRIRPSMASLSVRALRGRSRAGPWRQRARGVWRGTGLALEGAAEAAVEAAVHGLEGGGCREGMLGAGAGGHGVLETAALDAHAAWRRGRLLVWVCLDDHLNVVLVQRKGFVLRGPLALRDQDGHCSNNEEEAYTEHEPAHV
mmetsp:Transcript_108688/g.303083  ORF Transcript_108688/g.303083 Transcript_108688/m.303083 type:complete len:233 (+) Transcript_108688:325-1023(+)